MLFRSGAPVYLLDMGEPIRIVDLAKRMIELSGFTVFHELDGREGDIEIKEIGLRPGEKLHEELLIGGEVMKTSHPKIKVAVEEFMEFSDFWALLSALQSSIDHQDETKLRQVVAGYFGGITVHNSRP